MIHTYNESRLIHYYTCGSCGKKFIEIDGLSENYEKYGPRIDDVLSCKHCNKELEVAHKEME